MDDHDALEAAVWRELADGTAGHEASNETLSEAIERIAPAYFDRRFGCFSKKVYRRLNELRPAFSFRFETLTRSDGVKVAGDIAEAAGPADWRTRWDGTPASGLFYRIQSGDTLLGVARRAYSSARYYWGSQWINFHPFNRRLWRTDLADARLWPHGRISFSPRFSGDLDAQVTTRAGIAGAPRGSSFGVIFIPHATWAFGFEKGGATDTLKFDVRSSLDLKTK